MRGLPHPKLEKVAIATLKPNPRNARRHSTKQIGQIAASIRKFGFLVPIVADDDGLIAAGHGRWTAAQQLGLETVPVVRAKFLSDDDRRAFAIAENRLGELSTFDPEVLAGELNALFDKGYALEITGFATSHLDFSLPNEKKQAAELVEIPDPTSEPVTRPGDLWWIGPHRLLCGDATKLESYDRLLDGDRAAMVFADAPYNVKINGHVSGLGKVKHREFAMASGEMSRGEFTSFLRSVFRALVIHSSTGSIHYHCMDWRHCREILDAADGVYTEHKQLICWLKNQGMGTFYRARHELIFVFKAGLGKHINNFGLGETGRNRTNVWEYASASAFRKGRTEDLADHPTIKPLAMVVDAIRDCSNRGDLILDPFSGSGTTLSAAYKTGRRGAALEIDPLYCDTTIKRLEAISGLKAFHADGRSFDDVACQRQTCGKP